MKPGKPLERRSPLQRKSPLRTTSPAQRASSPLHREADPALPAGGPRLRRESPKRAKQMGMYRHLRVLFLAARPWCESPWPCGQRASEIQHRRGRRGERLLDERWWAASCHACNTRAETNTGEALALNWLVREDDPRTPADLPILTVERAS